MTTLVYGPQTDRIEALLTAVRELTPAQIQDFRPPAWDAAWDAERATARAAERATARAAERAVAGDVKRDASWAAARYAVWVAVGGAMQRTARAAACDAVSALIVLDLVDQYDLTRGHIDTLAAPLLQVLPELARLFEPVDIAETEPHS
jgi:hypothetical protein